MVPSTMATLDGSNKVDRVSCLVHDILACHDELTHFKLLKPCPKVNAVFERLVELCSQCPAEGIVEQVRAPAPTLLILLRLDPPLFMDIGDRC